MHRAAMTSVTRLADFSPIGQHWRQQLVSIFINSNKSIDHSERGNECTNSTLQTSNDYIVGNSSILNMM